MTTETPIALRPLSPGQRTDCLYPNCAEVATCEAYGTAGTTHAAVRCCRRPAHQQHAVTLARAWLLP